MSKVNLLILVDEEHRERILEVVEALQASGMEVEQLMEQIGVITGFIDSTRVEQLSRVQGVASVEPAQEYQIAPPDSEIQ